jgi:uncharacterized protein YdaU (DUF1376 family)
MHYYKFGISDWALHTSHLTLIEEAIYFRLINHYYDSEKPIPLDLNPLIRRLRLDEKNEVVQIILDEFFIKTDDGYRHKRCDEELATYHAKADRNREVGKLGGRPKKTQSVIFDNPTETLTNNYKLITKNNNKNIDPPEGVSVDLWNDFLIYRKRMKSPVTPRVLSRLIKEAELAKMPLADVLETIIFKGWKSFDASWMTKKIMGSTTQDWRTNDQAMMAKANELGLHTIGLQRFEIINKIDATIRSRGL